MFPLVLVGLALVAVVLRKRGSATDGSPSATASSSAEAVTAPDWNDAFGEPNGWDTQYPLADPAKVLPYSADDLEPDFRARLETVLSAMTARGLDPKVFEAGRTQRRQAYLWGQGRLDFPTYGREGSQVTWTLTSNHGAYPARAVDVISKSKGWSDQSFFTALGEEAGKAGLTWGGNWKARDYPHVELT
jgi:hypothetical protein